MGYFDGWFGDHYWDDSWWDPTGAPVVTPPTSGSGGVSKSQVLGTSAPRPALPPWRQIEGPTGNAFTDIRRFLSSTLEQTQNWGNHVEVTFAAANTPTPIDTGLGGPAKGYKIVRSNAQFTVCDATPGTPDTKRGVIWLQASAPGTATLYIYG